MAAAAFGEARALGKPQWAAEAVWYQIFPDRFCNGDPNNDPPREYLEPPIRAGKDWKISSWTGDWYARDDWEREMGPDFYRDGVFDRRYGGDLQGVIDKLDYIQKLGITAIYLNPIFMSHSLHKYDGDSYHHIDPYFGPSPAADLKLIELETADPATWKWTAADKLFLKLVKECHARGMRIILDGVFNHTGRDFFAFKDIRKNQERSRYKDWYVIESFDDPRTKRNEFSYKGWWGVKTLPIFTASADGKDMHPGPKRYIFDATERWMKPNGDVSAGIDGWRLDVAFERPAKFWSDWNALVRRLNPEAYTTAEIWESAADLIRSGGFSASMNYYAFAIPVKGFFVDNNIPPSRFSQLIEERRHSLPAEVAPVMQNLMDSHDTDRLASMIVNGEGTVYKDPENIEFNLNNDARASDTYNIRKPNERERRIQRMIVLFQVGYPGAPMFYYGSEAGMWGGHDPDERMPMVWPEKEHAPQKIDPRGREREADEVKFDQPLFEFHQRAIAFRRATPALNHGAFKVVAADDDRKTLVVERNTPSQRVISAFNRSDSEVTIELPGAYVGYATALSTDDDAEMVKVSSDVDGVRITLPALTGAALTKK